MLALGREAVAGGGGHGLERVAEAGGHGRGHGALYQRRGGEQHKAAPPFIQQVDGQLCGEHGAAEVHEDEHAVVGPHVLDRRQHLDRVGAEGARGLVEPAGGADAHLRPGHLRGQLGCAFGEPRAVTDDDEADHRYAGSASPAAAPPSAAAAVSSSNHELVAPGS